MGSSRREILVNGKAVYKLQVSLSCTVLAFVFFLVVLTRGSGGRGLLIKQMLRVMYGFADSGNTEVASGSCFAHVRSLHSISASYIIHTSRCLSKSEQHLGGQLFRNLFSVGSMARLPFLPMPSTPFEPDTARE